MENISYATRRNWEKLGVKQVDFEYRLSKRANKRYSLKNIIPVEYLVDRDNINVLNEIISICKNLDIKTVIYSLALNLIKSHELSESGNIYLKDILSGFWNKTDEKLLNIKLPENEYDFLGVVYQSLLKEGNKNIKGSYYTPKNVISLITSKVKEEDLFLDPCCGTGSFLLDLPIINPENIYGCEIDDIACFIAKINLIVKYKNKVFNPKIFQLDFLKDFSTDIKFDIIATNPPWGALLNEEYKKFYPQIHSAESYSFFIVKTETLLKKSGLGIFVLPESILNVHCHKDIRQFILKNFHIDEIQQLGKKFSGVLSEAVLFVLNKDKKNNTNIKIIKNEKNFYLPQKYYSNNVNNNFSLICAQDIDILNKIYSKKHETLSDSIWALGIVTGNNKKFIFNNKNKNYEKIYTGKEISKYFLNPAKKYIHWDKNSFQQTAPEEIYRLKEKLVYKFISKKLVFAYDNEGALFLNSANILIPKMKYHTIKSALAFLNSDLFQYIYLKKFNEIKILQGNIKELPFPILDKPKILYIEQLVDNYLSKKSFEILNKINQFIYKCFDLNENEIKYIKNEINV